MKIACILHDAETVSRQSQNTLQKISSIFYRLADESIGKHTENIRY